MNVLWTLWPALVLALLGAGLRSAGLISPQEVRGLNRLNYLVGLPSLLFTRALNFEGVMRGLEGIALSILATALGIGLIAYLFGRRATAAHRASAVQGAFRGNLAFIGVAVLTELAEGAGWLASSCTDRGVLSLGIIVPAYNALAVTVLSTAGESRSLHTVKRIVTNPLLLGALSGFILRSMHWSPSPVIMRPLELLAATALPLGLISIGASVRLSGLRTRIAQAAMPVALKLVASPLLALLFAELLSLSACDRQVVLVLAACPSAVAGFIMAEQMGADAQHAADIIAFSTIAWFPVMSGWLFLMTQLF